jgi:ABC-type nitrate/sulfonate/bicarbonate transport system substrate-binding protein
VSVPTPRSGPVLGRRRFLQLTGLGVAGLTVSQALAACGSDDDSSDSSDGTSTLSVQLSWIKDSSFAPLLLADDRGYYRDAGLSVDMIAGGPDIGAIEGIVAGGTADVGIATDITSTVAAIADGNPLVCIGAIYQANLNALISPPGAPITTVEQLRGKRIGGPQGVQTKFDAMFVLNGLDPDYTFVPVGFGPDSLINGDVDALAVFITDEAIAYEHETGDAPAVLTFTDAGLPAYTSPIFTTRQMLEDRRADLKAFLAATLRGVEDDVAEPADGATLAVEEYAADQGLDLETQIEHNEAYVEYLSSEATQTHGYLWIDTDFLTGEIYRGMEAAGLATAPVDQVVDMSLLEELQSEQ